MISNISLDLFLSLIGFSSLFSCLQAALHGASTGMRTYSPVLNTGSDPLLPGPGKPGAFS
jgi:hypothetical protein